MKEKSVWVPKKLFQRGCGGEEWEGWKLSYWVQWGRTQSLKKKKNQTQQNFNSETEASKPFHKS